VSFTFLRQSHLIYHNVHRQDTFTADFRRLRAKLALMQGNPIFIEGGVIVAPDAAMVRAGQIASVEIFFPE
jgi:hypothetical protein